MSYLILVINECYAIISPFLLYFIEGQRILPGQFAFIHFDMPCIYHQHAHPRLCDQAIYYRLQIHYFYTFIRLVNQRGIQIWQNHQTQSYLNSC